MITLWLSYATILALGIAVAARTIEPLCRMVGKPSRMVWGIAICLAVGVPPGLVAARSRTTPERAVVVPVAHAAVTSRASAIPGGGDGAGSGTVRRPSIPAFVRSRPTLPDVPPWLDTLLLRLWGAGSALLLLIFSASVIRTARRRRGWTLATLDGVDVHVSEDVGPALVGIGRPRVVVPRWVLGMGAEERRLVLAHECEHARAADPALVAGATLAVICAPWNVGLWYMLRRLRLAVEVDCDRRVVRQHADVRRYCSVLLEVGEQVLSNPVLSTALARANSDLRSRVEELVAGPSRSSRGRLASGIAMSGALLFLSCTVPNQPASRPVPAAPTRTARGPVAARSPAPDTRPGDDSLLAPDPRYQRQLDTLLERDSISDSLVARLQDRLQSIDTVLDTTPLLDTLFGAPNLVLRDSGALSALRGLLESRSDSVTGTLAELTSMLDLSTPNIRAAIAQYFPDQLTGDRHAASGLWFLVGADGAVVRSARTMGAHAPAISADVVARRFAGISTESIDEIRILSGRMVGVPDAWVVWAVLRRGTATR
jgi:hypothetical protein